jgi:hypothetical protein
MSTHVVASFFGFSRTAVAIRAAAICAPEPISETEKQKAKIRFEKLFLLSLFLGNRNGGDPNAANRDGLRSGNAMRVFVRSPIGGKSKELLSVFADERIARLVAEHLLRGSLVVPPTGDVENVIEMAREAARIGRLLMSEQVRRVTYTLEEREALVLINTLALWTAEP